MEQSKKQLIVSIINFLKSESSSKVDEDLTESLEVVVQCLETSYGIQSTDECDIDLLEIFNEALLKRPAQPQPMNTTKSENIKKEVTEADKQRADALKNEGNNLVKAEKYNEAVDSYTAAINIDSKNAVYFCNRAAALTKLQENHKAIVDCEKAIEIDPSYSKAYGRLGLVYLNEKNYEKAVQCYEKAVNLEPANQSYKNNLEMAKENLKSQTPTPNNPLAGMDLGALLNNPAVMNMAQSFMNNPQMQNMFSNFMGGAPPSPSGRVDAPQAEMSTDEATSDTAAPPPEGATAASGGPDMSGFGGMGGPGGFQIPQGLDLASIMNATQQFASQMRQENPDLVDDLRQQFQQPPPPKDNDDKPEENA